jgi:hypothetical protein
MRRKFIDAESVVPLPLTLQYYPVIVAIDFSKPVLNILESGYLFLNCLFRFTLRMVRGTPNV